MERAPIRHPSGKEEGAGYGNDFGRDSFIEDGTPDRADRNERREHGPEHFELVEEMSKEYQALGPMLHALHTAESSSTSDAQITRQTLALQISQTLESMKSVPVGSRKSILRHILGSHTNISSPADKERDYLWTRDNIRPRKVPKSIVWSPRQSGSPELVLAEIHKADEEHDRQRESLTKAKDKSEMGEGADIQTESKVRRHNSKGNSITSLRTVLERCGELLSSVQSAQKGRRATLGDEDREQVEAEVSELQQCVAVVNDNLIDTDAVEWDDVRKAVTVVLGTPGQLWTKQHPDGRDIRLFFNERTRHLELLLKKPRGSSAQVHVDVRGRGSPVKIDPRAQAKQRPLQEMQVEVGLQHRKKEALTKFQGRLQQCNRYLGALQRRESTDLSNRRDQRALRLCQNKLGKLVSEANSTAIKGGLRVAELLPALREELGRPDKLWTVNNFKHDKTILQFNENNGELSVSLKSGSSTKQGEESAVPRNMRIPTVDDSSHDIPVSVPHTTAASIFVYGVNAVLAALSAKKRLLYHLYIDSTKSEDRNRDKILTLAQEAELRITSNVNKRLLDRMSNGRPHNGIVLEASQVPTPPTLGLGKPMLQAAAIPIQLDAQNVEDASVNGAPDSLPLLTETWRHPFVLMLDGILDEGNMGNILRTAYFYGVDAVAISKNTCASVNSPIVAKASSGAIEAVQILSLPAPSKFVYNSLRASWKVYAAVAPPLQIPSSEAGKYLSHSKVATSSPLRDQPCILMLGAEGEGLRNNLRNRADHFVSIEQGERPGNSGALLTGIGVDSMNVGSAAGILIESFMRKPASAQPSTAGGALGF